MQSNTAVHLDGVLKEADEPVAAALRTHRPGGGSRSERVLWLCEGMIDIAAALFNISSKELRQPGRSAMPVSRVRQIAMYVAHVSLRLSMKEVARGFGRDRTTVVYACHLIEDMRDDPDFDQIVAMTERVAVTALGMRDGV